MRSFVVGAVLGRLSAILAAKLQTVVDGPAAAGPLAPAPEVA